MFESYNIQSSPQTTTVLNYKQKQQQQFLHTGKENKSAKAQ